MSNTIKQYKCQTCGEFKASDQFETYTPKQSGKPRAKPHCIACSPDAVLLHNYRKEIRTKGVKAFTDATVRRQRQLDLRVQVMREYTIQP